MVVAYHIYGCKRGTADEGGERDAGVAGELAASIIQMRTGHSRPRPGYGYCTHLCILLHFAHQRKTLSLCATVATKMILHWGCNASPQNAELPVIGDVLHPGTKTDELGSIHRGSRLGKPGSVRFPPSAAIHSVCAPACLFKNDVIPESLQPPVTCEHLGLGWLNEGLNKNPSLVAGFVVRT